MAHSTNRSTNNESHSTSATTNNGFPIFIPIYTPPRRGLITPQTDFDALMHFVHNAPTAEVQSSKKRKGGEGKAKEERGAPGMNCYGTKDTPLMSWLKRVQVMGLRPGGGTDAGGNGGEGSSGSAGQGATGGGSTGRIGTMGAGSTSGAGTLAGGSSSVGMAGTGGEKTAPAQPTKRAARRSRALPKRAYTWRDPGKKNKSGQRGKGKVKAEDVKGKGKE
jgi:hypothetical protein